MDLASVDIVYICFGDDGNGIYPTEAPASFKTTTHHVGITPNYSLPTKVSWQTTYGVLFVDFTVAFYLLATSESLAKIVERSCSRLLIWDI